MKPFYRLTPLTETPPAAKLSKSCTNLCEAPETTTDTTATEIMISAARWFVATPAAIVGGMEVTVDNTAVDPCATVDVAAAAITVQCVTALESVLESIWLDIKAEATAGACLCDSATAVCITEAPWGADSRCVNIPDNTTTADQLCYGPCEHVAAMLGVATAVVAVAGGAAYTLRTANDNEPVPSTRDSGI